MRSPWTLLCTLPAAFVFASSAHGNVKSASDYAAPKAPAVRDPLYNPYTPTAKLTPAGSPSVFNHDGTVVRPTEPATDADRPPYEAWATGAVGGSQLTPPGTF